ncbi:MAG TPA: hypothetical protein VN622_05745, partial [Clostridia bacterium]|nr:hypothetical protein [Clostridia bacterium]
MSTMIVLKDANALVLGTDSRLSAHDYSRVLSDRWEKIREVAPQTYIATSGRRPVCEFQEEKARELASQLGTTDIKAIGEALGRETVIYLLACVERLCALPMAPGETGGPGNRPLHGTVLVGRTADGELGYVTHAYSFRAGRVVCETGGSSPEAGREIVIANGDPGEALWQDPATWSGDPVEAVRRFLSALKQAYPHIGGADQIIRLDRSGPRWISRPPEVDNPGTWRDAVAGYAGAWFKRAMIGGASPADAPIVADANGNVSVLGSLLTGRLVVGGANQVDALYAYDGSNGICAWIGKYGSDYGFWGRNVWIGGSSPANAKIKGLADGSVTITDAPLTLNLNGVTTKIHNEAVGGSYAGLTITLNGSGRKVAVVPGLVYLMNDAGAISVTISGGGGGGSWMSAGEFRIGADYFVDANKDARFRNLNLSGYLVMFDDISTTATVSAN